MKKLLVLIIGILLFASCSNSSDVSNLGSSNSEPYPKLQIVNDEHQDNISGPKYYIDKVSLVNYVFEPLYLSDGESQTFILDKGMPAGYDDILVAISWVPNASGYVSYTRKKKVSFKKGKTAVVKLSEM